MVAIVKRTTASNIRKIERTDIASRRTLSKRRRSRYDFVDEWVSAPYPRQQRDRELMLGGLKWLDEQAKLQFNAARLCRDTTPEQCEILDSICTPAAAVDAQAAQFFSLLRSLYAVHSLPPQWACKIYNILAINRSRVGRCHPKRCWLTWALSANCPSDTNH